MIQLNDITEDVTILTTRAKRKHNLLSVNINVDTETSKHIEYDGNTVTKCYGWIYLYGLEFAGAYSEGRTPSDLIRDLETIRDAFGCSEDGTHVVVYIHNLSYDIQYLKDFLIQRYGGEYDMLAVASHKFITFRINAFEFRCSYKLSNRRLAKWAEDLGVEHQKQTGEIDYTETHYQDEPLAKEQHHYLYYDVMTLKDCIREQMRLFGDNLLTIPLTSTGYVRREIRKKYHKERGAVERFKKTRLTATHYVLCRREFAGGLTHGNRDFAGDLVRVSEIQKQDKYKDVTGIRHRDFTSHYPTQQRARLWGFPKTRFMLFYDKGVKDRKLTLTELMKHAQQNCLLVEIAIHNLKVKPGVTLPYAQAYKFIEGKISSGWVRPVEDNGRLLTMPGTSIVVLNELDLTILIDQYYFDYEILRVHSATRGCIPEYLKETIDYYFKEKTRLKKVVKDLKKSGADPDRLREAERDLLIVKQLLNSIYGCTATQSVRTAITMDTNGVWSEEVLTPELLESKLKDYYNNYNNCTPYQLGCWTTALARYQLWYVVSKVIGYDHFLYADTDSAFYLSTPEIEQRIEEYNARHRDQAEKDGAYIEVDGHKEYYDYFDDENENITEFKFLHAKAYAYITEENGLKITVAGVPDIVDGVTRETELGSIDNFEPGFVFRKCGGTRVIYSEGFPHTIEEDGHVVELAGSAVLENVTKTLNSDIERTNIFYDDEIDVL